jgi:hypothetical protein
MKNEINKRHYSKSQSNMEDIMKNRVIILLTGLVLALAVPATHAAIIKVEIQATITSIMDQANILGSNVSVGDEITGWYAYDTSIPPSVTEDDAALYVFTSAPCGIFLSVNGFSFETDINDVYLEVGVLNNYGLNEIDEFWMRSRNNLSLPGGMPIDFISFQLVDENGQAIDSHELPVEAPTLTDWQSNYLNIDGTTEYINPIDKKSLVINAVVTSAVLVPEPVTTLLLITGSLAIRLRKK